MTWRMVIAGNEIKAVDGRVRTGIAWKGRRQPDLSLTGQFPATGGRSDSRLFSLSLPWPVTIGRAL
eukprot:985996-Rhodomonas_salina.1